MGYQRRVHGEFSCEQGLTRTSAWARVRMRVREAFPRSRSMYKDCFKLMDINKDGMIDKNDLRGAFDNVGVLMSEEELDSLLGEISGGCTPDNMIAMFQEKMAGDGNDPDDLVVQAFMAYAADGKIDYMIKSKDVVGLFVAVKEEEKKEEAPPPVEEAA